MRVGPQPNISRHTGIDSDRKQATNSCRQDPSALVLGNLPTYLTCVRLYEKMKR